MKRQDWLVVALLFIFLPLFLYNLGAYSLVDFDEGWYAEIARNILVTRQPLFLSFNDAVFFDHPPFGFLLMALSFAAFGITEFAARFPAAVLGWACVVTLYFLGRDLFKSRLVGLGAALVLVSSVWFIFRARSGNLDTIFLFFYVFSFYAAVKVKDNPRWLFPLALSLSAVLLTKSVIGVTIILPILAVFVLEKVRPPLKMVLAAIGLFLLTFSPWYVANYLAFGPWFLQSHINLGLRSSSRTFPDLVNLLHSHTIRYLHSGIGKWFYPSVFAFIVSSFLAIKEKRLIPIVLLLAILLFGFLTNTKTEIWHLLPLYPFFALLTSFVAFKILKKLPLIFTCSFLALALWQIYQFRNSVNLHPSSESGLAHTAKSAKNYPGRLYLDASDFFPSAVFYSQRHVYFMRSLPYPKNTLSGMIAKGPRPFLLLTEQWRLDTDKVPPGAYQLLDSYQGAVLIAVK